MTSSQAPNRYANKHSALEEVICKKHTAVLAVEMAAFPESLAKLSRCGDSRVWRSHLAVAVRAFPKWNEGFCGCVETDRIDRCW